MTVTGTHATPLAPAPVSGRTYGARLRSGRLDAAALLGLMICLITLVPANLIVPNMTPLARPGLIVGMLLFCWWVLTRFSPHLATPGPQPIRRAVLFFMVAALLSYAAGYLRVLTTIEMNSADKEILFSCLWLGVMLAAADGIPNRARLHSVLKVLVVCAGVVAVIALVQYVLEVQITDYMIFPGLEPATSAIGFEARGEGIRVAGTATHYIELSAFLAMVLPFAIHFAYFGRRPLHRQLASLAALLMSAGIAATISRTGMLAVAVMLVILFPVWRWRMRYNFTVVAAGALAVFTAMSPGLVTTILQLFGDASSDTSITLRTARYPLVFGHFAERPWLGRGFGTWTSPQYQILDNQWLSTLVSNGAIGVAALAGLHLTAITLAGIAFRRAETLEDRHLCAALISTQVIAIVVAGTFDSLSFSTYAAVLALTLGLCGTVWRLTRRGTDGGHVDDRMVPDGRA